MTNVVEPKMIGEVVQNMSLSARGGGHGGTPSSGRHGSEGEAMVNRALPDLVDVAAKSAGRLHYNHHRNVGRRGAVWRSRLVAVVGGNVQSLRSLAADVRAALLTVSAVCRCAAGQW